MEFLLCDTPFGQIGIWQEEEVLVRLYLPNTPVPHLISRETPLLKEAEEQLLAYCAGERILAVSWIGAHLAACLLCRGTKGVFIAIPI